jgi:hypothetical protein
MNNHHPHKGSHKIVAVVKYPDGGVEPYLGESVGQEKREHKEPAARKLEPGYGVACGNTEYHGYGGGNDGKNEGQNNGGNKIFLGENKFPPSKTKYLGNDSRYFVDIPEGQDNQIQDRAVKKEKENSQDDEFPELFSTNRKIQAFGIQILEHINSQDFPQTSIFRKAIVILRKKTNWIAFPKANFNPELILKLTPP